MLNNTKWWTGYLFSCAVRDRVIEMGKQWETIHFGDSACAAHFQHTIFKLVKAYTKTNIDHCSYYGFVSKLGNPQSSNKIQKDILKQDHNPKAGVPKNHRPEKSSPFTAP